MIRTDRHGMAWIQWEPNERDLMLHYEWTLRRAGDGDQEAALELAQLHRALGLPGDIGYYWPEHRFMIPTNKALCIRT